MEDATHEGLGSVGFFSHSLSCWAQQQQRTMAKDLVMAMLSSSNLSA